MPPLFFPDEVLEHVLVFLTSHKDRNHVSLVCRAWYKAERWSRKHLFIGNCYAVSPEMVTRRFPRLKSVTLKGKPRFADFGLLPNDWGASIQPWVEELAMAYPGMEELRFKRMSVTDESLELIGRSFPNFKVLVLTNCEGFSVKGLSSIARLCRHLTHLDLSENHMVAGDSAVGEEQRCWIESFPETCVSLEVLNFAINDTANYGALRSLVARCPSLKSLNVSKGVDMDQFPGILMTAPQLVEVGTGSHGGLSSEIGSISDLRTALRNCKGLRRLAVRWDLSPTHFSALQIVCSNLVSLDISLVPLRAAECEKLIFNCHKLQKLWCLDFVGDKGLVAVARSCSDLRELRVYPLQENGGEHGVTEVGLYAIAQGCPNLESILYFCNQMTNQAVQFMALKCPNMTRFRLAIMNPRSPDCVTGEPMDEGFGAIVKHCRQLRRLAVSGLLTDKAFQYIGEYGKGVQTLSVAFAADSDMAMNYVLQGCPKLRKLEIRDCPFGDEALVSGIDRYESMRFLWMSSCNVTYHGCRYLAGRLPSLNVEIIKEDSWPHLGKPTVAKLYIYRSVAGPRKDAPDFIATFRSTESFVGDSRMDTQS